MSHEQQKNILDHSFSQQNILFEKELSQEEKASDATFRSILERILHACVLLLPKLVSFQ